jgi:hypothetical protein
MAGPLRVRGGAAPCNQPLLSIGHEKWDLWTSFRKVTVLDFATPNEVQDARFLAAMYKDWFIQPGTLMKPVSCAPTGE